MESLEETTWDVVISGTGLPQSLLALALSRSGKKILHLDKNDFYGGPDAALSLQEVEKWVENVGRGSSFGSTFRDASLIKPESIDTTSDGSTLSYSRAYSLSLLPQLIYTRSSLLPVLVSSRVYRQLEFQAVGHWWLLDTAEDGSVQGSGNDASFSAEKRTKYLRKVPNGREDIFADASIDFKSKRYLMKFLQFVATYEQTPELWSEYADQSFPDFLSVSFNLPKALHPPLLAIAMSPEVPENTSTAFALGRIARHLRSIGVFGPGFGAVIPKWGGGSEIAQVACRACAVGGGVYILGKGIESVDDAKDPSVPDDGERLLEARLEGGDKIRTKWIVGTAQDLPEAATPDLGSGVDATPALTPCLRAIYIVSSPLKTLFLVTAEGGPPPAGVVLTVPSTASVREASGNDGAESPPVQVLVHSSDTGECPQGQSVLYASMLTHDGSSYAVLDSSVRALVDAVAQEEKPDVLYALHYTQLGRLPSPSDPPPAQPADNPAHASPTADSRVLLFPPPSLDLAFDDRTIDDVKQVWKKITSDGRAGNDVLEENFMVFEDREDIGGDGDGDE